MTRQTSATVLPWEIAARRSTASQKPFGLDLADDLLRCVPGALHGQVPGPVWPHEDSHSPWTRFWGPRQVSDDPDEAANALLNLAGDQALGQRCSKAAKALVEERFNSDRCHRKWLELLQMAQLKGKAQDTHPESGLIRLAQMNRLGRSTTMLIKPQYASCIS